MIAGEPVFLLLPARCARDRLGAEYTVSYDSPSELRASGDCVVKRESWGEMEERESGLGVEVFDRRVMRRAGELNCCAAAVPARKRAEIPLYSVATKAEVDSASSILESASSSEETSSDAAPVSSSETSRTSCKAFNSSIQSKRSVLLFGELVLGAAGSFGTGWVLI
jgi:hypothetical protein